MEMNLGSPWGPPSRLRRCGGQPSPKMVSSVWLALDGPGDPNVRELEPDQRMARTPWSAPNHFTW